MYYLTFQTEIYPLRDTLQQYGETDAIYLFAVLRSERIIH